MTDFSSITQAAARDPLVVASGLHHWRSGGAFSFQKTSNRARSVRVVFLLQLTIALSNADIVPFQPLAFTGSPFLDAVHGSRFAE